MKYALLNSQRLNKFYKIDVYYNSNPPVTSVEEIYSTRILVS
jgi:hypothetical protein